MAVAALLPQAGVDPRLAALVGMAALFTGASHSMLAWVVFAFETTRQPVGLLPLLGGCAAAYLVSMLNMRYSIMTEKIARRGIPVARGYEVDYLRQQLVKDWASTSRRLAPARRKARRRPPTAAERPSADPPGVSGGDRGRSFDRRRDATGPARRSDWRKRSWGNSCNASRRSPTAIGRSEKPPTR